ncbi:MAG: hypothetical protein Q9163_000280 [Psora crenata]
MQRASFVRRQLQEHDMPVDDAPNDEDVRQTYNFAPGSHGLVYRADVPDRGADDAREDYGLLSGSADERHTGKSAQLDTPGEIRYILQSMKWGLVPFWTKRNPDYSTVLRTINARDDSLASKGGMWNNMKQKKRCVVVAQGFYEWLKKNGGKEKIPHYVKRKDEQLMCFAGLWDCVQYEGSGDKHYTYTVITTDSNKQLSFLHDRMPVILENGSDEIRTWLDPRRSAWSKELQSLLKPFRGDLECYPVSKEVGKVGNNSPNFIVPVASSENKNNISNFFGNSKKSPEGGEKINAAGQGVKEEKLAVREEAKEKRTPVGQNNTENNAPLPIPASVVSRPRANKREHGPEDEREAKAAKRDVETLPRRSPQKTSGKKMRSATNNGTAKAIPTKRDGSQKITSFLNQSVKGR